MATPTNPHDLGVYLEEGIRIVAILLAWAVLAFLVVSIVTRFGIPGNRFGARIGTALIATGFLNAVLYVVYRGIEYWHAHTTGEPTPKA